MYTPKEWWYERPRFGRLRVLYRSLRFTERVLPNDPHFDYLRLEKDEYEHILQGAKDALRREIENLIGYTCRWIMRPVTVDLSLLEQSLRAISETRVTKLAQVFPRSQRILERPSAPFYDGLSQKIRGGRYASLLA